MPKFTRSFITGSWAYGNPNTNYDYCVECGHESPGSGSDVDIVVLVSQEDLEILEQESESCDTSSAKKSSVSLRFGRLNLICETNDNAFLRWKIGTKTLLRLTDLRETGISREESVALFECMRQLDYNGWWNHSDEINKITAQGLLSGAIRKIKKAE